MNKEYEHSYYPKELPYEEKTALNKLAENIFRRNRINKKQANKILVKFEKKLIKLYRC